MAFRCLNVLALILALAPGLAAQNRPALFKALGSVPGWSPQSETSEDYDAASIGRLLSPKAAVLKAYGVVGASAWTWKTPQGAVRITLIEMSDTSAAYGLFTLERAATAAARREVAFGAEGFQTPSAAWFWQAHYLVGLSGEAGAIETAGRALSERILGESRKPPVSRHIPPQHLADGSERYILSPASIQQDIEIDPQELGFGESVEVASARYSVNGKTATLWLLQYPTQQVAKKFSERLWPAPGDFEKRVGPLVAFIHGTRDRETAQAILGQISYRSQVTWDEPKPDISIVDVVLTVFTFIGIALAFVTIAGVSFGGLRVFIKSRYPNAVFDRAKDMEIIQLKIDQQVTRIEGRD